jgi:hypothetical protein
LRQNASILEQRCAGFSPGSANRCDQFTRHPGRTSSPLRPRLSCRYTQPVSVLRRSHDRHRDIPARLLAALPNSGIYRRDQDRHIMIKVDPQQNYRIFLRGSRPEMAALVRVAPDSLVARSALHAAGFPRSYPAEQDRHSIGRFPKPPFTPQRHRPPPPKSP